MSDRDPHPMGWAFLVARGRRYGHRTQLVPGVLRDLGVSGVIEDTVDDAGPGPVVRYVPTPQGQVAIVARTHQLQPGDLDDAAVLDDHGRPLELIYGFVCLNATVAAPDGADLHAAFHQALAVYRRFLADESGFVPERSEPYPLRSVVQPLPAGRPAAVAGTGGPPGSGTARPLVLLGAGGVVAAVVIALLLIVPALRRPSAPPLTGAVIPKALIGTWSGPMNPVQPDGPAARQVTVTVACPGDCTVAAGTKVGTVDDTTCGFDLLMDNTGDGALHATVRRTRAAQCLPDGPVVLTSTGAGTATLDWSSTDARDPVMRAPILIKSSR